MHGSSLKTRATTLWVVLTEYFFFPVGSIPRPIAGYLQFLIACKRQTSGPCQLTIAIANYGATSDSMVDFVEIPSFVVWACFQASGFAVGGRSFTICNSSLQPCKFVILHETRETVANYFESLWVPQESCQLHVALS